LVQIQGRASNFQAGFDGGSSPAVVFHDVSQRARARLKTSSCLADDAKACLDPALNLCVALLQANGPFRRIAARGAHEQLPLAGILRLAANAMHVAATFDAGDRRDGGRIRNIEGIS
jgi:hypothetical protein